MLLTNLPYPIRIQIKPFYRHKVKLLKAVGGQSFIVSPADSASKLGESKARRLTPTTPISREPAMGTERTGNHHRASCGGYRGRPRSARPLLAKQSPTAPSKVRDHTTPSCPLSLSCSLPPSPYQTLLFSFFKASPLLSWAQAATRTRDMLPFNKPQQSLAPQTILKVKSITAPN